MSANAITTPYHHFVGLDGLPLEDGYIYIGTANTNAETSPISVYWDSDLTIPAAQPIRTVSGYMSKNGSPGTLFVNGDYSITVRDKNKILIYTAFESNNVINISYAIANSTAKTTPVDADSFGITDSAASNILKKTTWANIKNTIVTSLGAMISTAASKATPIDADIFVIADSASSNSTKRLTWANVKTALTASPTFTGTPEAPTAPVGTDTTQIATTAFVNAEISGDVGVANSPLIKTALNATGAAPIYACRAWANFNGVGTVAIRGSGNVSSITDVAAGNYVANLITAMEDTNFVVAAMTGNSQNFGTTAITDSAMCYEDGGARTTTSFKLRIKKDDIGHSEDRDIVQFVVFR